MNASAGVIEEILAAVESWKNAEKTFSDFVARYPKDEELLRIQKLYRAFSSSQDEKQLSELKIRLKKLQLARKIESSGGGDLMLKDRRKFSAGPKKEYED